MGVSKVSPRELYLLRRAQLHAEREALVAHLAQQAVKEFLLDLERKYGLLGKEGYLDIHSGIVKEVDGEPNPNANQGPSGPAR